MNPDFVTSISSQTNPRCSAPQFHGRCDAAGRHTCGRFGSLLANLSVCAPRCVSVLVCIRVHVYVFRFVMIACACILNHFLRLAAPPIDHLHPSTSHVRVESTTSVEMQLRNGGRFQEKT